MRDSLDFDLVMNWTAVFH